MKIFNIFLLVCLVAFVLSEGLGSLSLYYTAGTTYINLRKLSRSCSIEYNFNGEYSERTIKRIQEALGATVTKQDNEYLFKSSIGEVHLKKGLLKTSFFNAPNGNKLHQGWIQKEEDYYTAEQEVGDEPAIKKLIEALEEAPVTQLSTFVNVQVPSDPILLRDLMVNMIRPENRNDMKDDNHFIEQKEYSKGFKELLLQQVAGILTYQPTMDQLYDDFLIRQTAESFPNVGKMSFKMEIEKLRELVLTTHFVPPSYVLDITPILLAHKPNDPITELFKKFVTPSESVQFREFKGFVDVAIRRAVGIVKATEIYGPFVADSLLSEVTYVEKLIIAKLREKILDDEAIVYKYITWDPETCTHVKRKKTEKVKKLYEKSNVVLGFMQNNLHGIAPLIIPGESTMWHQRVEHRFSIIAKYNPALINFNLIYLLYNKFYEFKLFENYCKGTFARIEHLMDILPPGTSPFNIPIDVFVESCNKAFPEGWVAKGIWDWNSGSDIFHHKIDYHKIMSSYRNSSFEKYSHKVEKFNSGCEPKEDLYSVLRTSPYFLAWKLDQYLKDGRDGIVQAWMPKHSEYRIEGYSGRFPVSNTIGDFEKPESEKYIKKVNKLFVKCNKQFPEKIRALPLSADIALLPDLKSIGIYETNPGGNCYLIHHDGEYLLKHNRFLASYPRVFGLEQINNKGQMGLDEETQILVIKDFLKQWGKPLEKYERHFTLLRDRLLDDQNVMKTVNLNRINSTLPQEYADSPSISLGRRYKVIRKGLVDLQSNLNSHPNDFYKYDDYYDFIYTLLMSREAFSKAINDNLEKLVDFPMEHFKKRYNQDEIIRTLPNGPITSETAQIYFKNLKKLLVIQTLSLPHDNLREKFDQFFSGLKIDKKKLFPKLFDIEDIPNDSTTWLNTFAENLDILWRISRTGYSIPEVSIQDVLQKWLPKIRTLYTKKSPQSFYYSLLNAVTKVIHVLSDYSLFYLSPKMYVSEFSFILSSIPDLKEPILLGKSIDAIYILNGDDQPKIRKLIAHARDTLAKQVIGKKGTSFDIDAHQLKRANSVFRGFLEHSYLTESKRKGFGTMATFETYKTKLEIMGHLKHGYTFFVENPKYQNSQDATPKKDEL